MGSYAGGMRAAADTLRISLKASADAEQVAQDHGKGKHQGKDKGSDKGKGQGKVKDKGKGGHAPADAGLTATSWTSTVKVRQKCAEVKFFDPSGDLFEGGAHMPLLCYIGNVSRRSADALQRRETQSAARGWGPEIARRSALMQSQGYGPRRIMEREEQDTWAPAGAGWTSGVRDGEAPAGAGWWSGERHGGWGSSSSSWQ